MKRAIDEGIVKREDVFVTSKLWNTFHARDKVVPIAKKQLEDWGLEYFDLFLIHFRKSQSPELLFLYTSYFPTIGFFPPIAYYLQMPSWCILYSFSSGNHELRPVDPVPPETWYPRAWNRAIAFFAAGNTSKNRSLEPC